MVTCLPARIVVGLTTYLYVEFISERLFAPSPDGYLEGDVVRQLPVLGLPVAHVDLYELEHGARVTFQAFIRRHDHRLADRILCRRKW